MLYGIYCVDPYVAIFSPVEVSYIQCGARDYRFIAVTPFFTMDTIWKQKLIFWPLPLHSFILY